MRKDGRGLQILYEPIVSDRKPNQAIFFMGFGGG